MKILENSQLLMDCPICGTKHYVNIIKRESRTTVEEKEVIYPETVYLCRIEDNKDLEFIPAKTMDKNLAAARKVYRDTYGKKADSDSDQAESTMLSEQVESENQ